MAHSPCLFILVLGAVLPAGVLSNVSITLDPATLTLTPDQADSDEGYVNVTCHGSLANENGSALSQLSIIYLHQSKSTTIVRALKTHRDGIAELRAAKRGADVTGSVAEGEISLRLKRASCDDSGRYTCRAYYATHPRRTYADRSQRLAISVSPGPLIPTRSPRMTDGLILDDVLTMTCQGPLGTLSSEQQLQWVWEYRDTQASDSPWQPYGGAPTDVVSGPMDTHHKCYTRGSSTLTRRLSQADSDRQYRCYVRIGGASFTQFAATFVVGTVQSSSILSGTSVRLTPTTLTLTPDQADKGKGHVDVTCQSPLVNQSGSPLWQLSIVYVNQSESTIVRASKRSLNGAAEIKTGRPGAVVSGNVTEGQISLRLSRATCQDSGGYVCRATYASPSGGQPTYRSNLQRLNITVAPGQLTSTQSPREPSGWRLDDVLTMTCEGPLGTVSPLQQPQWVWEYQNTRAHNPLWQPYDGAPTDVVSGPMDTHHKCYARGSSTLTRRLSQADSDRQYRCYVRIGGASFTQFAAIFVVGTVQSSEASEPRFHKSLFLGLGVGGCVGMTVGVVGVVAAGVVIWFWGRRRRLMRKQSVNCPLLPTHRDPGWYGEYLEPMVRVPQQEQEDQCSLYSEIPEDITLAKKASLSSTSRK